jgi:2-oxoglutarate ferredoxin oxidoreductase subunit gamma
MRKILTAGYGGQGILFTGNVFAYAGMLQGKHVSWIPSYGPEMRGGTTNCVVIIADLPIGSPVINDPDIVLCFNLPSLDKFESWLAPGGTLFVNSSLAKRKAAESINAHYIPATQLAIDNDLEGLANMIMAGKVMRECGLCDLATAEAAMIKTVSERHQDRVAMNMKALDIGFNY